MKRLGLLVGPLVCALLGFTMPLGIAAEKTGAVKTAVGRVYDIDYGPAATQIGIMPPTGTSGPFTTTSALLQAVLETALLDGIEVEVTYGDGKPAPILSVSVSTATPGTAKCSDKDCVQSVRCTATPVECSARVVGDTRDAKTTSDRAVGVLLTAITKNKPVEYLDLDEQGTIRRVKVNVP